jgi:pimeloyl-ACP methyl ester carboxylesterase
VLIDAAGFNLAREDRPSMVRLIGSPAAGILEWVPGKRLLVERALRQVLHDDTLVTDERVAEYLAHAKRPGSLEAQRSLLVSLGGRNDVVTSMLPRVEAPTLVLWGREDLWIPPAHADLFASAIPRASKVVLDDCGHMPQVERAPTVARFVLEFLSETRRPVVEDPTSSRG